MPKNFAPNEPVHSGESFLVSKGLFTKSPLVGVWGDAPTLNATNRAASAAIFNALIAEKRCGKRSFRPFRHSKLTKKRKSDSAFFI